MGHKFLIKTSPALAEIAAAAVALPRAGMHQGLRLLQGDKAKAASEVRVDSRVRGALIHNREALSQLAAEWDGLFERTECQDVFLTHDWMAEWWEHWGAQNELFIATVREPGGRLVAIAPFYIRRSGIGRLGLRVLSFMGSRGSASDHLNILAEPGMEAVAIQEIVRHVLAGRAAWDYIELADADAQSEVFTRLRQEFHEAGLKEHLRARPGCPYAKLPTAFDQYLSELGSSIRYNFRRRLRNLERFGCVSFVCLTDNAEIQARFGDLLFLHDKRFGQLGKTSAFLDPRLQSFHVGLLKRMASRSRPRLYLLQLNGQAVAALYGFSVGKQFAFYQSGMDPAWAKLSVGLIALGCAIEHNIRTGHECFDFLRGTQPYKLLWAKYRRPAFTAHYFDGRLPSRTALSLFRLRDCASRAKKGLRKIAAGSCVATVVTGARGLTYMTSAMAQTCTSPARVIYFEDGWQARIFTNWTFPESILAAWDELAHGYGDIGVFLQSGWLQQSWAAIERTGRLFVIVMEHREKVVGVFPCWIRPDGRLRALVYETHFDFLVLPNLSDQVLDRFLDVLHQTGLLGGACFEGFPRSSAVVPALERRLRSRGIPGRSKGGFVGRYSRPHAPFIDLRATTMEQYTAALHSKLKRNLQQGGKRAQREGVVSFEVLRQPQSLDELLAELFEVEYRSWKGDGGSAIKCDPEATRFYQAMTRWAVAKGCLYVFCLRLDGRLIAFDLCVAGGRTMFAFKTGYDQSFAAKLSPGNQMRLRVIEYLFATGQFDCYDFLGPVYPWKLEWTSQANIATSLELYSHDIPGWYAYFRKYGWKVPFRRSRRLAELARRLRGVALSLSQRRATP